MSIKSSQKSSEISVGWAAEYVETLCRDMSMTMWMPQSVSPYSWPVDCFATSFMEKL